MKALDFALWDGFGVYANEEVPTADLYDDHLDLVRELDEAGWHSYFIIEHQNAPSGRISAPEVWLAAVARATRRLRFGVMMWQLPFHHPIRLAQEVATLDQLSRGRVEFGSGIGVHEHEFLRWDIDYYKRAAIAEEALAIIRKAWAADEVTFDGEHFRFDEALPQPRPYQQPHPPIWAAVHSDEAIAWAARNNFNLAKNLDTDDVIAHKFDLFRQVWAQSGHAGPPPRIFLQRQVHVAETDDLAHAQARRYMATGEVNPVITSGGRIAQTRIGWGSHARAMGRDSERPNDKARGETLRRAKMDYQFAIDTGLVIIGSPDTVAARITAAQERLGFDLFCTNHEIGAMPADMVRRSIRLFGEAVIPRFAPRSATLPLATRQANG